MLYINNEVIDKYELNKDLEISCKMDCWIKKENGFNIHLFTVEVDNEDVLRLIWDKYVNNIAVNFQSTLNINIERWNIYVVFFVKEQVSKELKYRIEQDKYSSRKIIYDRHKFLFEVQNELRMKEIEGILNKKLLHISVEHSVNNTEKNLRNIIQEINPLYYNLMYTPAESVLRHYMEVRFSE